MGDEPIRQSVPPGPPLPHGADRDVVIALLVELNSDVTKAYSCVDNRDRSLADLHFWLAEIVATAARVDRVRAVIPQPATDAAMPAEQRGETRPAAPRVTA